MVQTELSSQYDLLGIKIANTELELLVFPETGARIYSLYHKPSQTELLWHHPHNQPRLTHKDEVFDDVFPGGWDELFPTCDASFYNGVELPDHGEFWAIPWQWRIEKTATGRDTVYTGIKSQLFPVLFERRLSLDSLQAIVHLDYTVTNLSSETLKLIWGIHPLFAIGPHHRLDLPDAKMLVEFASSESMGKPGQVYNWPYLPNSTGMQNMSQIPGPEKLVSAGHYCIESSGNWFSLCDTQNKLGVLVSYPKDIFPCLWVWQTYGEWHGLYHLAVEPWTGYPVKFDQAMLKANFLNLKEYQTINYRVSVKVYRGLNPFL